jgi:hypothetical protein
MGHRLSRTQSPSWGTIARRLLELLGAQQVDSIDHSNFEGATLTHNLNEPVPDDLRGRYSLVWDVAPWSTSSTSPWPAAVRWS